MRSLLLIRVFLLLINQKRLNDLVHDLYLTKEKEKFKGPGSNDGISWNQEHLFHAFVHVIKTWLIIMRVQKKYAIAKILKG